MEKIIHYCWFGPKPLGKLEKKCLKSWEKFFPDYKIMKWSEEKIKNLLDKYLPIILTKEDLIDENGGFLIERYTEYGFNASYIHTYMEKKDRRYYSKFSRAATDYLMNDYLIYGYEKYTPEHWESFKKEAGVFFKSDWPVGSAVYFKKFNKKA